MSYEKINHSKGILDYWINFESKVNLVIVQLVLGMAKRPLFIKAKNVINIHNSLLVYEH